LKVMGFDARVGTGHERTLKVRVGRYGTHETRPQAQRRLKTRLGGQPFVVEEPERRPAAVDTPLMQQYREIKARHPTPFCFFGWGTSTRCSRMTRGSPPGSWDYLTPGTKGGAAEVPLAGVPVKAATEYLRRLIPLGTACALRAGGGFAILLHQRRVHLGGRRHGSSTTKRLAPEPRLESPLRLRRVLVRPIASDRTLKSPLVSRTTRASKPITFRR